MDSLDVARTPTHIDVAVLFNCASGLKYELPPQNEKLDCTKPIDYAALR